MALIVCFRRGWTTLGIGNKLSLPDHSANSSSLPATKRKGKRTRDANFFDTVQALEDRRAVVKESMHGDQMVLFTKADERQTAFQNGFLEVLSQLVKANRSSSL
ncbi:hypothetical protein OYC64_016190 [Pagothenia borchgrevinki]|uniref:Uncharacterized protein n=1 Tax=Pagothenia borchgrevinki TaxID=8213 RepID=A0ABD2HK44_PAGBO